MSKRRGKGANEDVTVTMMCQGWCGETVKSSEERDEEVTESEEWMRACFFSVGALTLMMASQPADHAVSCCSP